MIHEKYSFVLIRGLGHEARHWGVFVDLLKKQDFCSEVFLCDLPGAGVFYKEKGASSVTKMLEHLVLNYHEKFVTKKPLVLVGLSLGGMLALEYMAKYPNMFSACVLINSSVGSLTPWYRRMRLSAIPTVLRIALTTNISQKQRLILSLVSSRYQNDPLTLAEQIRIAQTQPIRLYNLMRQLFAGARFKAPHLEGIGKTLVLYSEKDALVDPRSSLALAQFLSSVVFSHPEAGHDLPLDDPQWIQEKMANFFEKREE